MTSKKFILLISIILLVFGILVVFVFDVNCIFKSITSIPCPGCGLTRGFRSLFSGNILKAEYYNILTIPIFLFFFVFGIMILFDIFRRDNKTEKFLKEISKHYIIIVLLVLITWIINIIKMA